jgi:hypothetical protein
MAFWTYLNETMGATFQQMVDSNILYAATEIFAG